MTETTFTAFSLVDIRTDPTSAGPCCASGAEG
jgi:hypothetical protein